MAEESGGASVNAEHEQAEGCGGRAREVTGSFLVFGLFFRQESGEGDNVEVDLLLACASNGLAVAIRAVSRHGRNSCSTVSGGTTQRKDSGGMQCQT